LKLPRELEKQILAMPGVVVTNGPKPEEPAGKPDLVEPGMAVFVHPYSVVLTLPVVTASEVNQRDWRSRSRRGKVAWKALSDVLGPRLALVAPIGEAFHAGKPVRVALTRLGGRKLDRSNLPTALKAVEDAVAYFLGADDGDPRWVAEWHQEPGGPAGVRVELSVVEGTR
jgi:hypothetical protein